MKKRGSTALSIVLAVALVFSAVFLGAYRGWAGERSKVVESFTTDKQLKEYLDIRAMDAANLRVVAARHLDSGDTRLSALNQVRKTLTDGNATVEKLVDADAELTQVALELQSALPQMDSVLQSSRDQAYITTLTRTLANPISVTESYNAKVETFNDGLRTTPTGWLAQMFGVTPLTAYGEN